MGAGPLSHHSAGRPHRGADHLLAVRLNFAEIAQIAVMDPTTEREHMRAIIKRVVRLAIDAASNARHAHCRDAASRKLADQLARTAANMHLLASALLNAGFPVTETTKFLTDAVRRAGAVEKSFAAMKGRKR
jgi:hypothetical protein